MKAKFTLILVLVLACIALVSCQTTVVVKDHVPATVNMSSLRNLAVASVETPGKSSGLGSILIRNSNIGDDPRIKVFTGWSSDIPSRLAKFAQADLLTKLSNTGFFTLYQPELTDAIFTEGKMLGETRQRFVNAGIEAILTSRVSVLSYDENIYCQDRYEYDISTGKDVLVGLNYYLTTSVTLGFEYNIISVDQNSLITTGSLTRKVEDETLAASWIYGQPGRDAYFSYLISSAPPLNSEFQSQISNMISSVVDTLAPRWVLSREALMDNKSKIKSLDAAYKLAKDGNYNAAQTMFYAEWQASHDLSSGYNAAILEYAKGDLEAAISVMQEVATYTASPEATGKLSQLTEKLRQWQKAQQQMTGTATDAKIQGFEIRNFFSL